MRAALALALIALALQSCAAVTPGPTALPSPEPTTAVVPDTTAPQTRSIAPEPSPTPVPPLPRCSAPERRVGTVEFDALCVGNAELAVERGIEERDVRLLVTQVEDDVATVLHEFAWTLRGRPVIYVFATTASYTTGLVHAFGYSAATAAFVAENSVAFFEPDLRTILVNWEAVRIRRPVAAIRHELTHFVTLEACAPRCDLVPAWLNEGQARLAEAMIAGGEWRLVRVRHEGASMVATNTLMPLSTLVTQGQWNAITSWAGYYKYQEAARATELLREDIGGTQPMARLYERLRRGENIARAYAVLAGRSFEAFVDGLAPRFADAVPAGPAIVAMPGPQPDHSVGYLLYGFAPEQKLTLRTVGRRSEETEEITVSPQGAHFSEIPGRYPSGSYTFTAIVDGKVVASLRVEKRGGRPTI